jgi:8-oxo-dGTP diphosphatase
MIRVTAAVLERDGKILIAKRKKGDRLGGKWEFPGGKLHPGEEPEACLRRELKEELDVDAEIGEFICSCKFRYFIVPLELLVYKARYLCGVVKLVDHDDVRWVLPSELADYDFAKADVKVVKKLMKDSHVSGQ